MSGIIAFDVRKTRGTTTTSKEQVNAQHIEAPNSPWNSPIFIIKNESGKWRIFPYLRAITKLIQLMGSLQPGIHLPSLLPKGQSIVLTSSKQYFFTIHF